MYGNTSDDEHGTEGDSIGRHPPPRSSLDVVALPKSVSRGDPPVDEISPLLASANLTLNNREPLLIVPAPSERHGSDEAHDSPGPTNWLLMRDTTSMVPDSLGQNPTTMIMRTQGIALGAYFPAGEDPRMYSDAELQIISELLEMNGRDPWSGAKSPGFTLCCE